MCFIIQNIIDCKYIKNINQLDKTIYKYYKQGIS